MNDGEWMALHPPEAPNAQLAWTALVDVADRVDLGPMRGGHRYQVAILGGTFRAGPGIEGLSGTVMPGGMDRQFLRPDGVKELDAIYEMQTTAGIIISVRNQVIIDESRQPQRYAMSCLSVSVEDGKLDWLNRRLFVGTLQSLRPRRQAVLVRSWVLDV